SGYGVLHLLSKNEKTRNTPFIFLSTKTETSDLRKGMGMGADDYITKPFEEIELLNAMEIRLEKKAVLSQDYTSNALGISAFLHDDKDAGLIDRLKDLYEIIPYSKKHVLYQENKRPRNVFYLVSGKVKTARNNEDGKEYIQELFAAGDFIGHLSVIDDKNYDN